MTYSHLQIFPDEEPLKPYRTMHFSGEDSVYLIGCVLGILDKKNYASDEETRLYLMMHGKE